MEINSSETLGLLMLNIHYLSMHHVAEEILHVAEAMHQDAQAMLHVSETMLSWVDFKASLPHSGWIELELGLRLTKNFY